MAMTSAQLTTLKAAIDADGVMSAYPIRDDGYYDLAIYLNQTATPAFTVWKTNVPLSEVGRKFNGAELGGLTTANHTRLQTIGTFLIEGVNPSLADNRAFFDDVFSGAGGANTRAALLALWKRAATRVEKIFAVGAGSDASPATMGFEGPVSPTDVQLARTS